MLDPIDQRRVSELKDGMIKWLEHDSDPVLLRERLAAMAHTLQATLCLPSTRAAVPNASALEVLMRAIGHDIEGDPNMKAYVKQKLEVGYNYLKSNLA